jgi:hypothetical protein
MAKKAVASSYFNILIFVKNMIHFHPVGSLIRQIKNRQTIAMPANNR